GRQPVGTVVELGVGPSHLLAALGADTHDRGALRVRLGEAGEPRAERLPLPVPERPVPRRVRGGPWRVVRTAGHRAPPSTPSAASSVPNFALVSASSASGSDPATMPAPAYTRTACPAVSAQRIVTTHSPSPSASVQPTRPA